MTKTPDFNEYWEDLNNVKGYKTLEKGYRMSISVKLIFKFRFYGNIITEIMISTGGFLNMGLFKYANLTATQYIAPLTANFDPTVNEDSKILYNDFGDRFVMEWQNVYLHDRNDSKVILCTVIMLRITLPDL
ncbi:plexin domain-containing protein 1-like [Saccostrea echinata]|uniref:plexin domain-containing protein 1-like n=1 Tax=Saccostrea echinata TaxID=191078 RepID=UPI002A7EA9C8|nr:plexin domain-containing protein 1-like [Saccostrea echinata]